MTRRIVPVAAAGVILLTGLVACAAVLQASAQSPWLHLPYGAVLPEPASGQIGFGETQPSGMPSSRPMLPDIDAGGAPRPNVLVPPPGNVTLDALAPGSHPRTPAAGYFTPGGAIGGSAAPYAGPQFAQSAVAETQCSPDGRWTFQILPDGLMYRAYLAGVKESRFASSWNYDRDMGWLWDVTLGGRVGVWRYGTLDPFWPEGWQLDIEGAGQPRLDLDDDNDLVAVDFRFGIPLTYRYGIWESKFGYYHLSSHLGDEFMLTNPTVTRINFSRDVLVLAAAVRPLPALRLYGEAGWAFASDVSEPWEFQFGAELSGQEPTGLRGAPFMAVGGHIREEVNFGGNLVVQTGWQWRGAGAGHLVRFGAEYYNGKSRQFEFFNQSEEQIGIGLWYDH